MLSDFCISSLIISFSFFVQVCFSTLTPRCVTGQKMWLESVDRQQQRLRQLQEKLANNLRQFITCVYPTRSCLKKRRLEFSETLLIQSKF